MYELSEKQRICLEFLQHKMNSTSVLIGHAIADRSFHAKSSRMVNIGSATANTLVRHGMVGYIRNVKSWYITQKGKDALKHVNS
jgi:hypothetical protein